ncbi:hypothetical protein NE237_030027 [Protea cynaroides]|uniref:Uncharacterized protein n=1 Tax=Protea cynaroides TaxID=273540 RepID=A0A9Q0JWL5_9MAGN|nr:hypothetical protein NE237_030027 [Protea cynaroides]
MKIAIATKVNHMKNKNQTLSLHTLLFLLPFSSIFLSPLLGRHSVPFSRSLTLSLLSPSHEPSSSLLFRNASLKVFVWGLDSLWNELSSSLKINSNKLPPFSPNGLEPIRLLYSSLHYINHHEARSNGQKTSSPYYPIKHLIGPSYAQAPSKI